MLKLVVLSSELKLADGHEGDNCRSKHQPTKTKLYYSVLQSAGPYLTEPDSSIDVN